MISVELRDFCSRWQNKAESHNSNNLQGCFDRFFTLFVIYNRLYSELAVFYVKSNPNKHRYPSDGWAAKTNVQNYLGARYILRNLESEPFCLEALEEIINVLESGVFIIKIEPFSGKIKSDANSKLIENLKSDISCVRVHAILDVIYSIRCNMFHGQKDYESVQMNLLNPASVLLERISRLLFYKMSNDENQIR